MHTPIKFVPARRHLGWLIGALLGCASAPAFAQVATVSGNANALDVNISITVLGVTIPLDVPAAAAASITNVTSAQSDTEGLPSLNVGNASTVGLSTGVLSNAVEYAPTGNNLVAGAESTLADVNIAALGLLGTPLLSITANQITMLGLISGYCAAPARPAKAKPKSAGAQPDDLGEIISDILYGNGFDGYTLLPVSNVDLTGLGISILGTPLANLPTKPPANTTLNLSLLNLGAGVTGTLVLNEFNIGGDGVSVMTETGNAVHLTLSVLGLINADVTLGHVAQSVACP